MSDIHPYNISITQSELDDLQTRIRLTRWPDKELVSDWSAGTPLHITQELCQYWQTGYDWRKCEALLNSWPQFKTEIDGLDFYFIHIKSKHAGATPLLLVHGWPGSVLEFRHMVGPLTDPEAHGGIVEDAFHLIIPALPGYGFSAKPVERGWEVHRTARAYAELMKRLGYAESGWVAQGGDWGAEVVASLGHTAPAGLKAVHLNSIFMHVEKELKTPFTRDHEKAERGLAEWRETQKTDRGYYAIHTTKPQTIAYGLTDSPAALAAWILCKMHSWSGKPDDIWSSYSKDDTLDNIMLYWLTNTVNASIRYYWECEDNTTAWSIKLPVGISWFPTDPSFAPREWAERYYDNIVHWGDMKKGGHFAAWEVPDLLVAELREWHKKIG